MGQVATRSGCAYVQYDTQSPMHRVAAELTLEHTLLVLLHSAGDTIDELLRGAVDYPTGQQQQQQQQQQEQQQQQQWRPPTNRGGKCARDHEGSA